MTDEAPPDSPKVKLILASGKTIMTVDGIALMYQRLTGKVMTEEGRAYAQRMIDSHADDPHDSPLATADGEPKQD